MDKILAVITARGGSKRIPKKNIKEFCGKPIIVYSIRAAIDSGIFDEVMVSTDDEEIKKIALDNGASVPFMRSKEMSNDFATTIDVLLEVINKYKDIGRKFDKLCCIYPTAPFITIDKLKKGFNLLENSDAVIPVVQYSFPPQRSVIINNNKLNMKWPQNEKIRSQDLEKLYHDCGQFYFAKVEALLKYKSFFTNNTTPMIISDMEVQDIDTLDDWEIAEIKYKSMIKNYI